MFRMDKTDIQSVTQAAPARWDWEMIREGGVGTRDMGKRGRAKGKGKEEDGDLIGLIKGAAISTSSLFA
jgi:hypothetical protein